MEKNLIPFQEYSSRLHGTITVGFTKFNRHDLGSFLFLKDAAKLSLHFKTLQHPVKSQEHEAVGESN